MDIRRVRDLIAELEAERKVIDAVLPGLRKLAGLQDSPIPMLLAASDSYVDLTVKAISANGGKPMRMMDIVNRIRILKGNPEIQRRSVEASIIQHVRTKRENSKIIKVRPGVWGLRKSESLTA